MKNIFVGEIVRVKRDKRLFKVTALKGLNHPYTEVLTLDGKDESCLVLPYLIEPTHYLLLYFEEYFSEEKL